jgi:type I restriction enzyme S subunit
VSADFFSNLQIPLPLVGEQKRIAGILDAADALRVKRRESLAQLDALLKSTFLTLFGDPIENPMEWEMVPLSGLGQVITGNTPSRSRPEFFGNDIEWIKSDNINTPAFKLTTASEGLSIEGRKVARTAPPRSVLVTCIAGSKECIGNAAVTD